MSSSFSRAQLEAERKARLKKQIDDMINKLGDQIQTKVRNDTTVSVVSSNQITMVRDDSGEVTYEDDLDVAIEESLEKIKERQELDFSKLLELDKHVLTTYEKKIEAALNRINERAILTYNDEKERDILCEQIKSMLNDLSIDIEDKFNYINVRINNFLELGKLKKDIAFDTINDNMYRYLALCEMCGEEPNETLPQAINEEVDRLYKKVQKQYEDEYIMNTISEIMEEMGCTVVSESVLDNAHGNVFHIRGNTICNVFVGMDNDGLLFEPIADSHDNSSEHVKKLEQEESKACALSKEFTERALERGVILIPAYESYVDINNICTYSDIENEDDKNVKVKAKVRTRVKKLKEQETERK